MTMAIRRVLTGMRTTGRLHLGHYVGALRQWVPLQETHECFFLLADIQALTTHAKRPDEIERSVREVVLDWLAVGLDPTRPNVHFVLQSGVRGLHELTNLFTMIIRHSEALKNPTIAAEMAQLEADGQSPTLGFVVYGASQVSDILGFSPLPWDPDNELLVPVGEDQRPHLEFTNVIADRFPRIYPGGKRVLRRCTTLVGTFGRLPGLDGQSKMSKSLGNAIDLADSADDVRSKVKTMFTDVAKKRRGDPGTPDEEPFCPVYLYHQAFANAATDKELGERVAMCRSGELGCAGCKENLAEVLNAFLDPIRARRKEAESEPLGDYLRAGTERAQEVVGEVVAAVRKAMHLNYPSIFKKE